MKKVRIILLLTIAAINFKLFAQGASDALRYSEPGFYSSARALSMGNAFNAISDDYSAFMFNPAGLGLLKRIEFGFGLNYDYSKIGSTLYGKSIDASSSSLNIGNLSYAFAFPTIRGSLTLGAALTQEKNFNFSQEYEAFNSENHSLIQDMVFYGRQDDRDLIYNVGLSFTRNNRDTTLINGNLNQYGSIIRKGSIHKFSLAGSVEIDKNLFFGLNIVFPFGSFNSDFEFVEMDKNNIYQTRLDPADSSTLDFYRFDLIRLLKQKVSGIGFTIGILYQTENYFRFGAVIQTPFFYTIEENYSLQAKSQFRNKNFQSSIDYEKIKYDIQTPFQITAGAAFNLKPAIFSFEATFIDYSSMEFTAGLGSFNRREINKTISEVFRSAFRANFGFDYELREKLNLRGGLIYQQSPYKNDPAKYDRKYLTGGIGTILGETLSIDFGFAYGFWEDYNDNYGFGESRVFQKASKLVILLNSSYRF